MFTERRLGSLFLASGMILASWCVGQVGNAAEPFTLTSPAFKDGTPLQEEPPAIGRTTRTGVGENVSPPLAWSNPPAEPRASRLSWSIRRPEAG